jgi:hypothetical protein
MRRPRQMAAVASFEVGVSLSGSAHGRHPLVMWIN